MAYANFKPTIWSKHIQVQLPKLTVFAQDCDTKFKGEIGMGKTVKILGTGRPTVGTYTPGSTIGAPETVPDTSIFMPIDQFRFYNFQIDDIDEAQSIEGLMPALLKEGSQAFAETADKYIADLCALNPGTLSSSTDISSAATTKAAIDTGLVTLWDKGVPMNDITMYLTPLAYQYMQEYIIGVKTDNDAEVASGILGKYSGAKVKMSNNLYTDATDYYCILKSSKSVAFAHTIEKVEAYRTETLFSDAVRALYVYGAKVVRAQEVYALRCR